MEVPVSGEPVQGSSGLVQLAAVAEAHSGLAQQLVPPTAAWMKGAGSNLLSSNMPSTPCSTLVSCAFAAHPYHAENQRLVARVQLLESQLANSQQETSSLTTALWDTSHALEFWQSEVDQLRTSSHEVLQHKMEYHRIIDQFHALVRALPGPPGQQHGLMDEANALATRQHHRMEELQEDIYRTRGHVAFVEQMIKEYPDEGFYKVLLPPLSQLEGDLHKAREDLCHVATFTHRLYHSDPATVLHHHHYIGAIIEAVVAFLCRGLDSDDPDIVTHNFRLALDYMQTARGIHGDLYMWSLSSIQWFFNNTVDFTACCWNTPGSAAPSDDSLEPPLHRRMLALLTALPHSDSSGKWDDIVPALPSIDQLTLDWEQLMLHYIHHITDTLMSAPVPSDVQVPVSLVEPAIKSLDERGVMKSLEGAFAPVAEATRSSSACSTPQVPLFLSE
ncbi:hypothetical protein EV368DRAFT_89571 [Lentinula lateritia]|nr:hypothetical protein EV368DRAFT_89571 [Lentinula lateritia]